MNNKLVSALALALLVGGLGLWLVIPRLQVRSGAGKRADLSPLPPARTPVLAGGAAGVEVLVKRRFARPESSLFAGDRLAERLGVASEEWGFLEVLILNRGEVPVTIDPASLVLEMPGRAPVPVRSLRALAGATPSRDLLLASLSPDPEQPLQTGFLRRSLVGVPRELRLEDVVRGRLGGISLETREASTASVESYLEQPGSPLLLAVLAEEVRSARPPAPDEEEDR